MAGPLSALWASLIPSARLRRGGRGGGNSERGDIVVVWGSGRLTLRGMTAGVQAAVRRLQEGGASIDALNGVADASADVVSAALWLYARRALERAGLLRYSVRSNTGTFATSIPIAPDYLAEFHPPPPQTRLTLSRFAFTRRAERGDGWILESPLAYTRIELQHPRALQWLHALGQPVSVAALVRGAPVREREPQLAFVTLLHGAGFLTTAARDGPNAEDRVPHLAQWEFADALVHARARRGRHDNPYGRVFPFRGRVRTLPLSKPAMSTDVVPLPRPNLEALGRHDLPFTRVLEGRRSHRAHGRRALNVRQLGEFLYRAARVQRTMAPEPRVRPYEASLRPSPGGGACHELELYVLVNRCTGLGRGAYHYDPARHQLARVAVPASAVQALLDDCPPPENAPEAWQLLIVIAARFGRVSWKYRGMSYATVLKDVGALMQTMYLVATAMRLAPCALGGGDAERFARLIGTDFFEETSVGEFLIGTRTTPRVGPRRKS